MKTRTFWTVIAACSLVSWFTAGEPRAAEPDPGASGVELKEFGCGEKGQKPCPMQGWMKSVMAASVSSGEGAKIATALEYVAAHPPPGMGEWVTISKDGAAKAKAGDVAGAKESCKKCHDLYKAKYKEEMRDRAF
jgi:hypothetical protein